jgi:exopolyphosphatase/guanosine-5'-triphosphate,3'-diphosphate pyrophosphatase
VRVAVVDLGTNSTRLLVADVENGAVRELDRRLEITRLGAGVDEHRTLRPDAIERVTRCVAGYAGRAAELHATRAIAVATSAVRDAANGGELLAALAREHGLRTRLLTGDEEAVLTYRGATAGRGDATTTLVVDVGGGSTELVVGTGPELLFRASLDVGCVRLTERFLHADPPETGELEAATAFVRALLAERASAARGVGTVVGVAGTVTTLATLHLGLASEDDTIHGHRLPRSWIEAECERLAGLTVAELREQVGLHPGRAPVIVGGAVCVREVLRHAGADALEVSLRDILHGAALAVAEGTF